ncbi:MAG: 50S ribosomal protein L11 methyltransferase [Candidatus Thorarchaeota archaeon]|nr:50S ribosomal protein L11 methyltransferase [Candidatus Thorarchaeota archaeon]
MMSSRKYATPFSLLHAVSLLSHRLRLHKFQEAIRQVVTPESYVVDLGTGTGVLAMLAAQAGARRVTAVDINKMSIDYAMHAARRNGLTQIDFVTAHFSEFIPDEPADVVICEMLSSMMLVEQQVPACRYAAKHILKENGIILPRSARVYIVPVECPSLWSRFEVSGLGFPRVPQTVGRGESRDLADAVLLVTHDFTNPDAPEIVESEISFTTVSDGIAHGLVGLFEADLSESIHLVMEDGWRDLFLPFDPPIPLKTGDKVVVAIRYIPGDVRSLEIRVS